MSDQQLAAALEYAAKRDEQHKDRAPTKGATIIRELVAEVRKLRAVQGALLDGVSRQAAEIVRLSGAREGDV